MFLKSDCEGIRIMQKERNNEYFLWKSFRDGDSEAFYRIYDQYVDELYLFGIHFSRDKDFVKDCIHDLFLDLHKYGDKLSDTDSIRFYLFRSLRRKIHKEQVRIIPVIDDDQISSSQRNQQQAHEDFIIEGEMADENKKLLETAMGKLTVGQREALFLKFEQNLSYPEIANILNISVESARTSIYRALKTLRKIMQTNKDSLHLLLLLFYRCRIVSICL